MKPKASSLSSVALAGQLLADQTRDRTVLVEQSAPEDIVAEQRREAAGGGEVGRGSRSPRRSRRIVPPGLDVDRQRVAQFQLRRLLVCCGVDRGRDLGAEFVGPVAGGVLEDQFEDAAQRHPVLRDEDQAGGFLRVQIGAQPAHQVGLAGAGLAEDRDDRLVGGLLLDGAEQGLLVDDGAAVERCRPGRAG